MSGCAPRPSYAAGHAGRGGGHVRQRKPRAGMSCFFAPDTWQHVKCLELDIKKQKKLTAISIREGIDKEILLQQRWLRAGGGYTSDEIKSKTDDLASETARGERRGRGPAKSEAPLAIGDRRRRTGPTPGTPAPAVPPIALQDIGDNDRVQRARVRLGHDNDNNSSENESEEANEESEDSEEEDSEPEESGAEAERPKKQSKATVTG